MSTYSCAGILARVVEEDEPSYLFIKERRVLNASREQEMWTIPMGKKKEGESSLETAVREFHEETRFSVILSREKEMLPVDYPRTILYIADVEDVDNTFNKNLSFPPRIDNTVSMKYFTKEEFLLLKNTTPWARKIIERLYDYI